MSGWLFLFLLRLLGIVLGIIALLGIASGYLHVEFKPYFTELLEVLQDIISVIFAAPLVERLLEKIRPLLPWVPHPAEHWRYIYSLTALMMMSAARLVESRITFWVNIPAAVICALVSSVYAGTMPVGSLAVLAWPIAGLFAFYGVVSATSSFVEPEQRGRFARISLLYFFIAGVWAISGMVFVTAGTGTGALVGLVSSPFGFGIIVIILSLLYEEGTVWQRLQSPPAFVGVNVISTLAGAIFLSWLFQR